MTTIASLDIASSFDPSGIDRGLSQAARSLDSFGRTANLSGSGMQLADEIISGATKQLLARQNEMQDALEKGLLNPQQLADAAEKASKEYKSALAKGVGNLAVQHLVTDEVRQKFEVAFGRIGNSAAIAFNETFTQVVAQIDTQIAGAQFSATSAESLAGLRQAETALQASLKTTTLTMEQRVQVAQQLDRVQDALTRSTQEGAVAMAGAARATEQTAASAGLMSRFINRSTGDFTALGRRASGALIGISFALDGIVQGGGKATDSVHGILRAVATVAPAFGPEGLLVSAVAAGTDAIIGIFDATKEGMKDAVTTALAELDRLNRGSAAAAAEAANEIVQGNPFAATPDDRVGLAGLRSQKAEIESAMAAVRATDAWKQNEKALQTLRSLGITQVGAYIAKEKELMHGLDDALADVNGRIAPMQSRLDNIVGLTLKLSRVEAERTLTAGRLARESEAAEKAFQEGSLSTRIANIAAASSLAAEAMAQIPSASIGIDAAITKNTESARRFVAEYQSAALRAFDEVTAAIRAHGPAFDSDLAKLAQMRSQLASIDVVKVLRLEMPRVVPVIGVVGKIESVEPPPKVPTIEVPVTFQEGQFAEMAKRLADLDAARRATESAGLGGETSRRAAEEAAQVLVLTSAWRAYVQTLIDGRASTEELAEASRRFEAILKAAGLDGKDLGLNLSRSGDGLDEAARAAHRLGDAFGDIPNRIGDVLSGIDDIQKQLDALKAPDLKLGASLVGFAGIFGAGAGIASSIVSALGPNQNELERNRILNENNQALANLAASLDRFGETAESIDRVASSLIKIQNAPITIGGNTRTLDQVAAAPGQSAVAAQILDSLAKDFGLSLAQLEKVARDNGIELLKDGGLVAGSLEQLQEALGITTESLLTWGKTFDQMQSLQKLSDRAHGIEDTPARELANTIKSITDTAGPAIDALFEGIDTSTKAGRDQLRKVIAGLVDQIELGAGPGGLTLADLAGFKDVQELGGALSAALDGLDAFGGALGKATDSLLNVPEIFKLARVRFESALPDETLTPPTGPQPPTTVPPEPPVVIPPLVIDSLGRLPDVLATMPDRMAEGTDRIGNALPTVMRDALDGATFGIQTNQFDALLDALRATVPGGAVTDRGGDTNFNGPIYVDARTKSVDEALDELVDAMRKRSRAGGIPLAGVRIT